MGDNERKLEKVVLIFLLLYESAVILRTDSFISTKHSIEQLSLKRGILRKLNSAKALIYVSGPNAKPVKSEQSMRRGQIKRYSSTLFTVQCKTKLKLYAEEPKQQHSGDAILRMKLKQMLFL